MRFLMPLWPIGLLGGAMVGALGPVGAALADQSASKPPAYYVGAGVRTGFNDNTLAVLDSKVKLTDLGDVTLSTRPALLLGDDVEIRVPLTVEGAAARGLYPFGGAGIAYNIDGRSKVDPILTGGLDIGIAQRLILNLELNVIFKSADTDTEFAATLNYSL
jgi:hypothetical protein